MEISTTTRRDAILDNVPGRKRGKIQNRDVRLQTRGNTSRMGRRMGASPGIEERERATKIAPTAAQTHLRNLFAAVKEATGKRYPALEQYLEITDIEVQRDFYRMAKALL